VTGTVERGYVEKEASPGRGKNVGGSCGDRVGVKNCGSRERGVELVTSEITTRNRSKK